MEYTALESKRLLLKKIDMCYAQDILTHFNRKITRYMYPKADETMEEVIKFIENSKQKAQAKKSYDYVILNKETNEFLGGCGYEKGIDANIVAFGIWIKEAAHHQKYGMEAVHCLYENAKKHAEYTAFEYYADRRNIGSRKIAESLGGICNEHCYRSLKNGNGEDLEMLTYIIRK